MLENYLFSTIVGRLFDNFSSNQLLSMRCRHVIPWNILLKRVFGLRLLLNRGNFLASVMKHVIGTPLGKSRYHPRVKNKKSVERKRHFPVLVA